LYYDEVEFIFEMTMIFSNYAILSNKKKKHWMLLNFLMAGPAGFEPTVRESKSLALPLGYGPIN
jgi:hypothetical protein